MDYRDKIQSGCCKGCDLVHEIETNADPAGEARRHILIRDENEMLRAAIEAAEQGKREAEELHVQHCAYGSHHCKAIGIPKTASFKERAKTLEAEVAQLKSERDREQACADAAYSWLEPSPDTSEAIVDEWQRLEAECMPEGHRFTMVNLIRTALDAAYQRGLEQGRKEDATWRELLAFRHGCVPGALYGDDGELNCCECGTDFKRMSAQQIETRWLERNLRALASQPPAEEPKPETDGCLGCKLGWEIVDGRHYADVYSEARGRTDDFLCSGPHKTEEKVNE